LDIQRTNVQHGVILIGNNIKYPLVDANSLIL